MKTKALLLFFLALGIFASCDKTEKIVLEEDEKTTIEEVLSVNEKYQMFKTKINEIHSMTSFGLGGFKNGSDSTSQDSSDWWDDWETCAQIDEYVDEEGFNVYVIDYGEEGCEEYGYVFKGKITNKWKYDPDSETMYFEEYYDDYEAYDMAIDGWFKYESKRSGAWIAGSDSSYSYMDFSFTGSSDMIITYENETMHMTSSFKETGTEEGFQIEEATYEMTSSNGYSFSSKVTKPLFYKYTCNNYVFIPVEGTEEINYSDNAETMEMVIDYGDGTCDNKFTVTINGETEEFDYDDEDWWADSDWGDDDSGTTN